MNAFNSADVFTKSRRGAKYDSVGPLYIGMRGRSVLGEHPFAALLPARYFCHNRRRNNIRHAAEPDFGPGFTGSYTDGFSKTSTEPSRE